MIYMRGHPQDYRDWARPQGRTGTGPESARSSRTWRTTRASRRPPRPGRAADRQRSGAAQPAVSRAFVQAGVECQLPVNPDFNGAIRPGVGLYQVTQKDGQRFSARGPSSTRCATAPNLTLLTGAQVHRVALRRPPRHGCPAARPGAALAEGGEVILSGGAINSPQLLLLSGIGPGAAPAGDGHPRPAPRARGGRQPCRPSRHHRAGRRKRPQRHRDRASFLPRALRAAWAYLRRGRGEFTSNVAEAGGFVTSDPGPRPPEPAIPLHPRLSA
jgi:choline dehydrogenase